MKTVCGSCGNVEVVEVDEKSMHPTTTPGQSMGAAMEPDMAGMIAKRKKAKKRRLRTLGAWDATIPQGKSLEDDEDPAFYLCGMDRKVHPTSDGPCATCAGGCHEEKGLPTLLEVEGLAEEYFEGMEVIDSGYGAQADLFIVNVKGQDGSVIEAIYNGSTAQMRGWHYLDDEVLSGKSFEDAPTDIITAEGASEVALKHFEGGEVAGVDADTFEGQDAWVVEMTTVEGESVDVYVGLDGSALGYDVYEKTAEGDEGETDEEDVDETDEEVVDEAPEGEVAADAESEDESDDKPEEKTADVGSLLKDLAELESISTVI